MKQVAMIVVGMRVDALRIVILKMVKVEERCSPLVVVDLLLVVRPPLAVMPSVEVVSEVVIMVALVEVVSAVASAMLLIVHHHQTTKDTIQISMIFTIM